MTNKKATYVNDLFTKFDFDEFSNLVNVADNIKLEYIKEMIALAKNDKQATFMYLAFSLTAIVLLIEKFDSPAQSRSLNVSVVFYFGIIILAVSAVFFFTYWRKTHRYHINVVSCIPTLNIVRARDLWIQLWDTNKIYFKLGLLFLTIGIFLMFSIILIL